jgi:hypothetical protein
MRRKVELSRNERGRVIRDFAIDSMTPAELDRKPSFSYAYIFERTFERLVSPPSQAVLTQND